MRKVSKLLVLIYICTVSLTLITASVQADTLNYEIRIGSGNDDAEEQNSNGNMSLDSSDLELTNDYADHGGDQTIGLRFNNIPIDPGAQIHNAYIRFTVDETANSNPCNLTIRAQADDNAGPFTWDPYNITTGRPLTSASTAWSPVDWNTVGAAGADQTTPSITAVIQEIIDRPGWMRGNSIVLIITGSGRRVAESYNGSPTQAPLLYVEVGPPALSVNITSPANGSIFDAGDTVTIEADASTPDGTVTKVEFFAGTTWLGEDTTSPYSFTWNDVPEGTYLLTAKATDSEGLSSTSASVTINVVKHPPAVSITSPTNGSSFDIGADITIQADASDPDGTVTKVEFFEGANKLGEDTTDPYSYDWIDVQQGEYELTAKATDNDLLEGTSGPVTISVVDNPPAVSITSPASGSVFDVGDDITIEADASDEDGTVTKVEFFEGAVKLGEDLSSPYSFTWNNVQQGEYELTAKATDNGNNTNTSGPVSITVSNKIDMEEFAILCSYWLQTGCGTCGGADYSGDNDVDLEDFAYLAAYWLALPPEPFTLVINEFMADNKDTIADPQNEYDDWIEIYHYGTETADLSGMYLTDDLANTIKWQFPSDTYIGVGDYLLIWADDDTDDNPNGLHANFKLSAGGEEIGLYDTDGVTLIDSISFDEQDEDISYGRYTDGTDNWYKMDDPTPEFSNTVDMSGEVYFSRLGGVITSSFTLKLSTAADTGQIRYTTTGSEPTASSTLYNDGTGITINNTSSTRIRARAFQPGLAPGPVATQAYLAISSSIQNYSSNLPIVVIDTFGAPIILDRTTKPWAYGYSAFFTPGPDGRTRLTDMPDHVGKSAIKHRGNSSYGMGGYRFEIQNQFGVDEDVPLLGLPEESDWVLHRLHYDDSYMRDVLAFQWSNEAGLYAPRTQYFVLFLNTTGGTISSNKGLYALTEYIKQSPNRVDIAKLEPTDNAEPEISGGYIIKKDFTGPGDITVGGYVVHDPKSLTAQQISWLQSWLGQSTGGDYRDDVNPKTFLTYLIMVEIFKPIDIFNSSTFLNKDREGKLNMGPVWDFNLSLGNPVASWPMTGWFRDISSISYINRILGDYDGYIEYIDLWFELREATFSTTKMLADIDYKKDYIAEARSADVNSMKTWLSDRLDWIDDNIGIDPPVININGALMNLGGHISSGDSLTFSGYSGTLYYTTDGTDPRGSGGSIVGTAYSGAITLTQSTQIKARVFSGSEWSALNEATFSIGPVAENLRITELMYHPKNLGLPDDPNEEFIELKNIGASTISLYLAEFTNGIDFTFPDITLAAGQYVLVVEDQAAFEAKYGTGYNIAGEYIGKCSNGGEEIKLKDAAGNTILEFDYDDDWYPITDGIGFSLNVINPSNPDPNSWEEKASWQASTTDGGTPQAAHSPAVQTDGDIVINEALTHTNDLVDGDWIELRNTTGSPINIGRWFLSDNISDLQKYEIAAGTTIPANGYVVFTAVANFRNAGGDPGAHVNFGLDELGERIFLTSGSGGNISGGYSTKQTFGAAENNVTFGRYTKSAAAGYDVDFVAMVSKTKGTANSGPMVPDVVITEIYYNPSDNYDLLAEYIELYNRSGSTITLYDPFNPTNTWKFTKGVDYTFPTLVIMTPSEYILIVRTDPDIFRYVHSISPTIDIYGPYDGALDNSGEKLELSEPGSPEPGGFVPYIRLEQVNYSDGEHPLGSDPWPTTPDGGGDSLGRKVNSDYSNDVDNWQAITPSPGTP